MSLITWSPTDKGSKIVLSNNNLTVSNPSHDYSIRTVEGKSNGKWYWEIKINSGTTPILGVCNANTLLNVAPHTTGNVRLYNNNGLKYPSASAYGSSYTTGDVVAIALDLENGNIAFYKNNIFQGVAFNNVKLLGGVVYPYYGNSWTPMTVITVNFGATPFAYPLPDGFLPYDIENASWLNPIKYLFQCNDKILKSTMNGLELVERTLNTQLFEEHGTEYLPDIIGQYDKEVDMVYKEDLEDKKIYGYKLVGYTNVDRLEVK